MVNWRMKNMTSSVQICRQVTSTLKYVMNIFITSCTIVIDAPIYIHLHGGYWQKLSRDMSSYMVAPLYKNGIKVFVVGYSLCPKAKVIDIMYQIKKAIAKCMAYAEENNAK